MRHVLGWLEYHRVPANERRKHFPGWNGHREVERADQTSDANRTPIAHRPLVPQLAWHRPAEEPSALTSGVIGGIDPLLDVAARFGQRLTHLARHGVGDFFLTLCHDVANHT